MKKVNMSSISNKIKFIYGDECEKNTVGMIIFSNGTDYFFDAEYKNKMSNEEVEALLLRGAAIFKDGKYYKPTSFDDENVSFGGGAVVDPDDIEVDLSDYATKDYVDNKVDYEDLENLENMFNDCVALMNSSNLLDADTLLENSKFSSGGDIISNNSYCLFEQFIEVDRSRNTILLGSLIKQSSTIALLNNTGVDACLYKENLTFISRVQNINTINIANYPEMRFIRISVPTTVFQARKIGVFYDELPIEWNEYGQYYSLTDNVKNNQLDEHIIDCWGDSLTNGVGADGNGYPLKLAALLGDSYTVNKYGNSGEGCVGIAARQGGYDIYLEPFVLPTTGTVAVEIYNNSNGIKFTNTNGMNPCYIDGVQCEFSISGTDYYLKQVNGIEDIPFNRPVKLNTLGSMVSKKHINIIWAGTNNTQEGAIDTIISSIQAMINNLNHNRYIIIGLTSKIYHSDIEDKNNKLCNVFGKYFLDIRRYILDFGLDDMGMTPTDDDNANIAEGEIPSSLLSDDAHFNETGYELISRLVYQKGKDLGYW